MTTVSSEKTFDAITTSPKSLQTILHCLSPSPIAKTEFCTIRLATDGLTVSVGGIRAGWQAKAFIASTLFTKYDYAPVNISVDDTLDSEEDFPVLLQVSLHAFIECLSMFQISSAMLGPQRDVPRPSFAPIRGSLRLVYEGDGQPFLVIAEENGVVTTCELTTYAPDEDEDTNAVAFEPSSIVSNVIMKSEWLHSALLELDSPSTSLVLTFRTSPRKPHFRLSTTSDWGGAEVDYPNEPNVLESFVSETEVVNSYRFLAVKMASRALGASSKVNVRTDDEGVLSMVLMIGIEGKNIFVEFRVIPNIEDEGSDDDTS